MIWAVWSFILPSSIWSRINWQRKPYKEKEYVHCQLYIFSLKYAILSMYAILSIVYVERNSVVFINRPQTPWQKQSHIEWANIRLFVIFWILGITLEIVLFGSGQLEINQCECILIYVCITIYIRLGLLFFPRW